MTEFAANDFAAIREREEQIRRERDIGMGFAVPGYSQAPEQTNIFMPGFGKSAALAPDFPTYGSDFTVFTTGRQMGKTARVDEIMRMLNKGETAAEVVEERFKAEAARVRYSPNALGLECQCPRCRDARRLYTDSI